jgi:hypothetical protein
MVVTNHLLGQTEDEGALPTLYAATQDVPGASFIGPSGLAEMRGHPAFARRSRAATDEEMARRLWELSESLTGVTFAVSAAAQR